MASMASMASTVAISMCQLLWVVAATYITHLPFQYLCCAIYAIIYTAISTRLDKKWTTECKPNFTPVAAHNLPFKAGSKQLWVD